MDRTLSGTGFTGQASVHNHRLHGKSFSDLRKLWKRPKGLDPVVAIVSGSEIFPKMELPIGMLFQELLLKSNEAIPSAVQPSFWKWIRSGWFWMTGTSHDRLHNRNRRYIPLQGGITSNFGSTWRSRCPHGAVCFDTFSGSESGVTIFPGFRFCGSKASLMRRSSR